MQGPARLTASLLNKGFAIIRMPRALKVTLLDGLAHPFGFLAWRK